MISNNVNLLDCVTLDVALLWVYLDRDDGARSIKSQSQLREHFYNIVSLWSTELRSYAII